MLTIVSQMPYEYPVHIGYSDNAGDVWAKVSLYPINYVWVSWRRGFIPRDNKYFVDKSKVRAGVAHLIESLTIVSMY